MKRIDLPPVWLAGFAGLGWALARWRPLRLDFGGLAVFDLLAGLCIGAGLVLMALAVWEMRRQRTTVVPHRDADRLVQSGIFSRMRNPIYLGDVLVLLGLFLWWEAVIALPLVPVFLWVIERRFVIPEENRLRRKFRADFARYAQKVRRWI